MSDICHCGKPVHYLKPETAATVRQVIDRCGPFIPITVVDDDGQVRTFWVQRHYLALHGIYAAKLPELGFIEVHG